MNVNVSRQEFDLMFLCVSRLIPNLFYRKKHSFSLHRSLQLGPNLQQRASVKIGQFFTAAIMVSSMVGCSTLPSELAHELDFPGPFEPNHFVAADKMNTLRLASHDGKTVDEVLSHLPLSSGQIVLTEDSNPVSLMVAQGVQQYLPYTHAGFLVIEDGIPFVYSMQSHDIDLGKIGTADWIKGGMDRETLKAMIDSKMVVSIFDPPPETDRNKLLVYIKNAYEQHIPFDPFLDNSDHSRLYCSEFISVALENANARGPQPVQVRDNHTFAVVYKWFNFRDKQILAPGLFADATRHVATLSKKLSLGQVNAFFAAQRELFQRFTDDQRIGALVEVRNDGMSVVRPSIEQFVSQVIFMARFLKTSDAKEIEEMVHDFARTYFVD